MVSETVLAPYRAAVIKRWDDDGIVKYFDYTDFPGLSRMPFSFTMPHGGTVRGGFFAYDEVRYPDRLVVFSHGLGGGYRSYMREIELMCRAGLRVAAFDNTGCFSSDGEDIRALGEGPACLDACLDFLAQNETARGKELYLLGHSAGGFSVGAVLPRHPEIRGAVILSAFASVRDGIEVLCPGDGKQARRAFLRYERSLYRGYARVSLAKVLRRTSVPVLYIQSEDDAVVPTAHGISAARRGVKDPHASCPSRVSFVTVTGKGHNPNYSCEAVAEMARVFGEYARKTAAGELPTVADRKAFMDAQDFYRITAQDPKVWERILSVFGVSAE